MKLLALDTSTRLGSVALLEDDQVLTVTAWERPQAHHTQALVPAIEWILQSVNWAYEDLNAIGVSNGPGSFTGVRVAVSVANGLGAAHKVPVIGISTLKAMAYGVRWSEKLIVPFLDAKKSEIYTAIFEAEKGGHITRKSPDLVIPPETFMKEHLEDSKQILLLGDGTQSYKDLIQECLGSRAIILPGSGQVPQATQVALLARNILESNRDQPPPLAEVSYLREPEAVISRRKTAKINNSTKSGI